MTTSLRLQDHDATLPIARNVQAGVLLLGAGSYLGAMFLAFVAGPVTTDVENLDFLIPLGWNLLLLLVAGLVIVDSIRKAHAGKTQQLATDLLVVKVAAIPFFLVNFTVLTWVAFFGSTIAALSDAFLEFGGSLIIGAAITIGLTYLAMLTTSAYGWATISQLRRDGRIGTPLAMLYRLMLLLFVADVVAGILLYLHSRRGSGTVAEDNPGSPAVRFVQAGVLLLGAVMYALVIAFAGELSKAGNAHLTFFIVGGWNTLVFAVTALAVVDGVRKVRTGRTRELATGALLVKLAAIPFFVLNFIVLGVLALGGMVVFILGGVVLLFAVWIGIGLTYLTMLSTSVYSWAAIARLRREKTIGTGLAALYTILSFGFVTDTATGVLLFGHSRRRPGLALVIVLVTVGAVLAVPGLLINDLEDVPDSSFWHDVEAAFDGLSVAGIVLVVATIVGVVVRGAAAGRRTHAEARAARTTTEGAPETGLLER